MIAAHADVVGSLLRPPELLEAQRDHAAGRITDAQFKAIEDRAVDQAVALQEAAGLEVLTDGEMRRMSFQSQMTQAVDGFGAWDLDAFLWGEWHGAEAVGDWSGARPAELGVVGKLKRKRHLCAEEFVYLRARTARIPKVTLPSPGLFANFWSPERSSGAYASIEAFLAENLGKPSPWVIINAPWYEGARAGSARRFFSRNHHDTALRCRKAVT